MLACRVADDKVCPWMSVRFEVINTTQHVFFIFILYYPVHSLLSALSLNEFRLHLQSIHQITIEDIENIIMGVWNENGIGIPRVKASQD